MYKEFIGIYIGLGVIFCTLCTILVLQILILKKNGKRRRYLKNSSVKGSSAFCVKCGLEFDALENTCPRCGTTR